jgi:phosphocarrier protein HPr
MAIMSDEPVHAEIEVTISNKQGLHARPIMRFVDIASKFASTISVHKAGETVDGKSPMEMMLLAATCGTVLKLTADGPDAKESLDSLAKLINEKFGEE